MVFAHRTARVLSTFEVVTVMFKWLTHAHFDQL